MPQPKKTFIKTSQRWLMNHPAVCFGALIVGIVLALIVFSDNIAKRRDPFHREAETDAITIQIRVRNGTRESRTIESSMEYSIEERVILMIHEHSQGTLMLSPLGIAGSEPFTIPSGEERDFRATLPEIPGYEQLVARGTYKFRVLVRRADTKTMVAGLVPFKRTAFKKYYITIDLRDAE